jgi:hypothetical protein
MAIVVIFTFPGGTVEQSEAVCREVTGGKPIVYPAHNFVKE